MLPLVGTAIGTRSRTRSSKELGTIESRKKFFIKFINDKGLESNITLENMHQSERNLIMAAYAVYLAAGKTHLCKSIKSGTIRKYLEAAVEISTVRYIHDPRKDLTGKIASCILAILKEAERWEKMPNRREPMTMEMVKWFQFNKLTTDDGHITNVISDWFVIGLQGGFRKSKWLQSKKWLQIQVIGIRI